MHVERINEAGRGGPAWIARVWVSKTGRTVYFKGRALQRVPDGGRNADHQDVVTGEKYRISGLTSNGRDHHWAGSGPVTIEAGCREEYDRLLAAR